MPASPQRLAQYLDVMGIQRWVRRSLPPTPAETVEETVVAESVSAPVAETAPPVATEVVTPDTDAPPFETDADSPPSWLSEAPPPEFEHVPEDDAYYSTAAFNTAPAHTATTVLEAEVPPEITPEPEPLAPALTQVVAQMDWSALTQQAQDCTACSLQQTRQRVLFGEGDMAARWLFIGDAPDADEDTRGCFFPELPLSGLFNEILRALQLDRQQVYFTNIVKCYPPKGREANTTEQQICSAYLARQIELLQPSVIVTLGSVATQQLLHSTKSISELRGQAQYYGETRIPVIPTFHPKYLVHRPIEKRKVWQDLQRAWQCCQSS